MPFFGQRQRGLDARKDMSKTAAGAMSSNRREPAMREQSPYGYEMGQQAARQAGAQRYDDVRRQHDDNIRAWAEFGLRKDAQKHRQAMDKANFGYRMRAQGMEGVPGVMGGDPIGQRPQPQEVPQGAPHTVVGHPEYGTVYRMPDGGVVNAQNQAMHIPPTRGLTLQPIGGQGMQVAPGQGPGNKYGDMYGAMQGQEHRGMELSNTLSQVQIEEILAKPAREQAKALADALEKANDRAYKERMTKEQWARKRQAEKEDRIYERERETEQYDRDRGVAADERDYEERKTAAEWEREDKQQEWTRRKEVAKRVDTVLKGYYDIMMENGEYTDHAMQIKRDWLGTGEEKSFADLTLAEQRQVAENAVRKQLGMSEQSGGSGSSNPGMEEERTGAPQGKGQNAPQDERADKPKRTRDDVIGDLQANAREGDAEARKALREMGVRW